MGAVINFQPSGSAPVDDAARQGLFSAFFFSAGNILTGIDDSPRIATGPGNGTDQLGPGTTLGIDVGVGSNGEVYIRGQAAPTTSGQGTTAAASPSMAGLQLSPGLLLLGLAAAFLLLRK